MGISGGGGVLSEPGRGVVMFGLVVWKYAAGWETLSRRDVRYVPDFFHAHVCLTSRQGGELWLVFCFRWLQSRARPSCMVDDPPRVVC